MNPEHPAQAPAFHKRPDGLSVVSCQAIQVRTCARRCWAEVRLPSSRVRFGCPALEAGATPRSPGCPWLVCSIRCGDRHRTGPAERLAGVQRDFGGLLAFVSDERGPRLMPSTLTAGQRRRLLGLERRKARQITWARTTVVLFQPAAPHHQPDRQAPGAGRRRQDFTQRHHRPRQNHGWVAIEDLGGAGHDQVGQGHLRGVRETWSGAGAGLKSGPTANAVSGAAAAFAAASRPGRVGPVRPAFTSQTCRARRVRTQGRGRGGVFACTACGLAEHADLNAARNIHNLAAGQAVQHAQHPLVARSSGWMREPLGSVA